MTKYIIEYNNKKIQCDIKRKDVKNINLSVKPNLKVIVSAPKKVKKKYIIEFIEKKTKWIYNHYIRFEKSQSIKPKEYVSGETLRYLGRQYMLTVIQANYNEVKYFRGKILMYVKDKSNLSLKKELYDNWLKGRAEIIFEELLDKMYEKIKSYNIPYPKMTVRKMKTRWGSCSASKDKININRYLIKAPKRSIEYVILHELVHFIHQNHSKDFYNTLASIMPDYEKRKKILDEKIIKEL